MKRKKKAAQKPNTRVIKRAADRLTDEEREFLKNANSWAGPKATRSSAVDVTRYFISRR